MRKQRAALAGANLLRADYLVALAKPELGIEPADVLTAALAPHNRALRALSLEQVFTSSRMTARQWRTVRRRMLAALEMDADTPNRRLTVGWLHDPRAGGRRHYALHDALRPRDIPPWPGFPWHPQP